MLKAILVKYITVCTSIPQGNSLRARLTRGAFGSAGLQAITRLLALLVGVLLARNLGVTGYGIYGFAIAIMTVLMAIAEFGIPMFAMRQVAASAGRDARHSSDEVLIWSIQLAGLISVAVAATGVSVLFFLSSTLTESETLTIMLMLLTIPIATLGKVIAHALWGFGKVLTAQLVLSIVPNLFLVILLLSIFKLVASGNSPEGAMFAQMISVGLALTFSYFILKRFSTFKLASKPAVYLERNWLNSILSFASISCAAVMTSQIDVLLLGLTSSPDSVALYRVAVQGAILLPAMTIHIANAILAPHFATLHASGDQASLQQLATSSIRITFGAALMLTIFFILVGQQAISILFGSDFSDAFVILVILLVGQLISIGLGQADYILNMCGHEKLSAQILWKCTILTVVLNIILVPIYAGVGAAIAMSIALTVKGYLMHRGARKHLSIKAGIF